MSDVNASRRYTISFEERMKASRWPIRGPTAAQKLRKSTFRVRTSEWPIFRLSDSREGAKTLRCCVRSGPLTTCAAWMPTWRCWCWCRRHSCRHGAPRVTFLSTSALVSGAASLPNTGPCRGTGREKHMASSKRRLRETGVPETSHDLLPNSVASRHPPLTFGGPFLDT